MKDDCEKHYDEIYEQQRKASDRAAWFLAFWCVAALIFLAIVLR